MQLKRNSISHMVCLIAMATMVLIAIKYAILLDTYFVEGNIAFFDKLDYVTSIGICAVAFFAAILITFFAGWIISFLIRHFIPLRDVILSSIESFLAGIVILGAFLYRIYIAIGAGKVELADDTLFKAAKVTGNIISPDFEGSVHGITYVYVIVLSAFMMFLGNTVTAVVALQILIQILSVLLAFGIGKKMYGYCTGISAAVILGFIPMYTEKIFEAKPGCLFALMFLLSAFLICCLAEMENDGAKVALSIFYGLITGAMVFLDGYLLLVMVIWLFAFVYELSNPDDEAEVSTALCYILFVVGMLAGFAVVFFVDAFTSGADFVNVLTGWWNCVYSSNMPGYYYRDVVMENPSIPYCMALVGFAFMSVIGFKKKNYCDEYPIWILMFLVAVTPLTISGYLQDDAIALCIYALLAGIGIRTMILEVDENETEAAMDSAVEYIESIEGRKDDSENNHLKEHSGQSEEDSQPQDGNSQNNTGTKTKVDVEPDSESDDKYDAKEQKRKAKEDKIAAKEEKKAAKEEKKAAKEEKKTAKAESKKAAKEEKKTAKADKKAGEAEKQDTYEEQKSDIKEETSAEKDVSRITEPSADIPATDSDGKIAKPLKEEVVQYTKQVDDLPGMIPNPLPLPAKRIHAPVSYKYEVTDDLMCFDTEISENDNFDL